MIRHRTQSDNGSLELLLDTICNMFGGIVFISLLVVVLLNSTSEIQSSTPPGTVTEAEFISSENTRRTLNNKLNRLRTSVAQQEAISEIIVSDETRRLAQEIEQSEQRKASLVSLESSIVGESTVVQKDINSLAKEATQSKSKLEETQQRLAAVTQQLEITIEQNTREAVIPKVVPSTKPPQVFFLKNGTLYGPKLLSGGSSNSRDFEVVKLDDGTQIVQERVGGGRPVDSTGKQNANLQRHLGDPWLKSFYVKLFVWPNSYGHVEAVRVVLEDAAIRCQIIPCERDTQIAISSTSTVRPVLVQ